MIWPHGLALLGLVCFAQLFPAQWPVFYDWETCIDLAYRLIPSKMSNVRIEAWEQDKALETKEKEEKNRTLSVRTLDIFEGIRLP